MSPQTCALIAVPPVAG